MADFPRLRLSVLDTVPVWRGSTAAESLRDTLDLAAHVERLGYARYWVAEHHNTPSLATSAPAVLAGRIAAATRTIRVGSGAVLLPNHAPLVVAEQFGVLEALHPGRIDLGIGRASGADPAAAERLRGDGPAGDDFPERLAELEGYFGPGREKAAVRAVPTPEGRPPVWLVGSSPQSAAFAGSRGLPYVYAHQIRPGLGRQSLAAYREAFRPSPHLEHPYAAIAASAVAAEDDARGVPGPGLRPGADRDAHVRLVHAAAHRPGGRAPCLQPRRGGVRAGAHRLAAGRRPRSGPRTAGGAGGGHGRRRGHGPVADRRPRRPGALVRTAPRGPGGAAGGGGRRGRGCCATVWLAEMN